MIFKYSLRIMILLSAVVITGMIPSSPQEGMYPLSELSNVDLKDAGLKIELSEIYNTEGVSLINALVNLGGCTAFFVSDNGLILTNHHCAFGAISNASTMENNYLENGFLANDTSEEIPAYGYTCKILESYEDVSEQVLSAVKDETDLAERSKKIDAKIIEIERSSSDKSMSIVADVAEMFTGKSYVLFKYREYKDVRLVFAPPRSVGEFGGESDNWVWPRHTGDFSFMRAYMAPDGSPAEYSTENIPYKPKKFLKVNPNGVNEGDFVFILGYPGRTFRHYPAEYVEYQYKYQLPYVSDLYEWMINKLESIGESNPEAELRYASRIKGLANTMKNYRGKLKGFNKLGLVDRKFEEEEELLKFIESDESLKNTYGNLFEGIEASYKVLNKHALARLWFGMIGRNSTIFGAANFILEYAEEMLKPENERSSAFKSEKLQATKDRMIGRLLGIDLDFELPLFAKMLNDGAGFEGGSRIEAIVNLIKNNDAPEFIDKFLIEEVLESDLLNIEEYADLLEEDPEDLLEMDDPLINLVREMRKQQIIVDEQSDAASFSLEKLLPEYYDIKQKWQKKNFIPDANGTLRFTYGYIKGYSPADAVYYSPITTLEGVFEKNSGGLDDYSIPPKLKELYKTKDYGRFYDTKIKGLPVAILYNTDTTGGNSGSPVLNAFGELIAINFDRAYEATINDFAWDDSYSRSIGADIRYVLWITQKLGGADYLLEEMGIEL